MIDSLFSILQGHIAHLAAHSNGNHVIQRCLSHKLEEYKVDVYEEVVKSCVEVEESVEGADRTDLDETPWMLRGAALSGQRAQEVPRHDVGRDRELGGEADLRPLRQLRYPVPHREGGGQREGADRPLCAGQGGGSVVPEVQFQCHREDPAVRSRVGAERSRDGARRMPQSAKHSAPRCR